MNLIYEYIGGNCPVQAEGTVNGVPFYFRARGQQWTMCIAPDPIAPCEAAPGVWFRREPWGEEPYDAGYMPVEIARGFIQRCAEAYERGC